MTLDSHYPYPSIYIYIYHVNPARYLQTGKSDHETKSNGAFGGLNVPMVGSTWVGNLHPTPGIELLQGKRGDHGCMAKARLFIGTGGVIQPHHTTDLEGMEVTYMWIEIPEEVFACVLHLRTTLVDRVIIGRFLFH